MSKATLNAALLTVSLVKGGDHPMHMQLTQQMRELILTKRLGAGDKLPSSRSFAAELAVSRITVTTALEQLISEGYAETRIGAGTYVASDLPDFSFDPKPKPQFTPPHRASGHTSPAFAVGQPDLRAFPFAQWTKLFDATWRHPTPNLLRPREPFGSWALRNAICDHLFQWRGMSCAAEQVVITSGMVEAIALISDSAFEPHAKLFVEDPCFTRLHHLLERSGLSGLPVPVDASGFDIDFARRTYGTAQGVVLTPSKQYPLGMTLPLGRRLSILEWARSTGSLILEDDFDGEYRYEGEPIPALMSLDQSQVTVYIGSFSKTMFPGLRLGFLVLPPRLVEAAQRTMLIRGSEAAQMTQPVLSRFINEGFFAAHLRKMRTLYRNRQSVLLDAIERHGKGVLKASASSSGMHLIGQFSPRVLAKMTDVAAAEYAADVGVTVHPLSSYFSLPKVKSGLVLGYATSTDQEIIEGVRHLVSAIEAKT